MGSMLRVKSQILCEINGADQMMIKNLDLSLFSVAGQVTGRTYGLKKEAYYV